MAITSVRRFTFQDAGGVFYAITLSESEGTGNAKKLGTSASISPTADKDIIELAFEPEDVIGKDDSYLCHAAIFGEGDNTSLNDVLNPTEGE